MYHPDKKPMTTMTSIIALVLKQYRLETGLSKNAFAARLNLTSSGWSKIENGDSVVSLVTLHQFANQFGIRPSNILVVAENCHNYLSSLGWDIVTKLDNCDVDALLLNSNEFLNSSNHGYIHTDQFGQKISILNLSIPPHFITYAVQKESFRIQTMSLITLLQHIGTLAQSGSVDKLLDFFQRQSPSDKDKIMMLLYAGRDHLHMDTLSNEFDRDIESFRKTVPTESYEQILTEKCGSLKLYVDAIIRSSQNSRFDLDTI